MAVNKGYQTALAWIAAAPTLFGSDLRAAMPANVAPTLKP